MYTTRTKNLNIAFMNMLKLNEKQEKEIIRYFKRYINKYNYILRDFEIIINKDNVIINFINVSIKEVFDFNVYNTYEKLKYCLFEYAKDFIKASKNMRYKF